MKTLEVAVVVGLAASGALVAARQAAGPVGVIRGHVIDQTSSQPVAGALVTLSGTNPVRRTMVAADGAFQFDGLPPGSFMVRADRPGYLPEVSGQRSPTGLGRPITLPNPAASTDLVLPLWRLGSIAGQVLTTTGVPQPGVEVHALERTLVGGLFQWTDAASGMTDDRGRYRLSNLTPGDFLVVARPIQDPETPLLMALLTANVASAADVMAGLAASMSEMPELDARVLTTSASYLGSTPTTKATIFALAPGGSKANSDLRVRPVHGVHVSGTLTGVSQPLGGLTIALVSPIPAADSTSRLDSGEQGLEVAAVACDTHGHFAFANVPPGHYNLRLVWMPPLPPLPPAPPGAPAPPSPLPLPSEAALLARLPIDVAATDLSGVQLPLETGLTVSGRIMPEPGSTGPLAAVDTATLRLEPVGAEVLPVPPLPGSRIQVDASGAFRSSSVPPG